MSVRKLCILLTACVSPDGMAFTKLQDSKERSRQYVEAINFYLQNTNIPIVFAENTLTDLSEKFEDQIKSGHLEYMTFQGNDYDKSFGKGYGEAQIIMYAYEHSKILRECDYVIKITGRLKVLNIKDVIESRWLNLKNIFRGDFSERVGFFSMILVINPQSLYNILKSLSKELNDSKNVFFEHIIYEGVLHNRITTVPFFSPTRIDGISGTSNARYGIRRLHDNLLINVSLALKLCYKQKKYGWTLIYLFLCLPICIYAYSIRILKKTKKILLM